MKWILSVLIALALVSNVNACGRGGYTTYDQSRSFVVNESFFKCVVVVLRKETTIKLLEQFNAKLINREIKEISLEKRDHKWFVVIKTDIGTDKGIVDSETVVGFDEASFASQFDNTTSSVKLIRHGNKTLFVLRGKVSVWRKFPNLFRRHAACVACGAIQSELRKVQNMICSELSKHKDDNTLLLIAEEAIDIFGIEKWVSEQLRTKK